ncbi:hypothetical protein ACJMK2_031485 [Sinanodonta woodiana]|uniref:C2H2-type domain-containing protein n=1 Tax=Sinanodonta woodiana TaxID=1069815 RepID=A0ABD3X0Q4_SINWO
MSRYHKGYRGRSRMEQSRISAYSPGRRLFASDLEALQLLSMKYNFATTEWKTRSDKNLSDRQIKNGANCTVSSSSLADGNSNNLELNSSMKLEDISVIETSTCHQKAPRTDVQEEKILDVKPFWKSNQAGQHGQMDSQSHKLKDRSFSDNVRAYLSGVTDISSKHHFSTCSKSMETKTEGLKLDLAKTVLCKQESSSFTQTENLEANSSLENIVSQSCTGTAASDSVTSSSHVTQGQNHLALASDTTHHPSYMGLASYGNVLLDSHGAESESTNSFLILVPSEEISGRVKRDQQRNKEPICFISSEGKKVTNQDLVWRQLAQSTGKRSGLSVSFTASLQNSFEPVHSTFGRETCENKVCLSNTTIIENNEETRPREPKNHFDSGNIMLTIPKSNVRSLGQMQEERTKSKKRWNNIVNSRVAKPVKISTRDPRRHGRLYADNFVQHFSGLGSVLQQSDCRVSNQSQDIEDCSGKIEIDKTRKEHLIKSGHFSDFNDSSFFNVNQQSTNEKSSFQESNLNYYTDMTTAKNTIRTTYFENCNTNSSQSVSSIINPIRRDASVVLPSNNFHVTDIQSMVNFSERCLEMSHTSSSAVCYWQSVPAIFQLSVDGIPSRGLTEEEAKLIDSAIAQDQDKLLDVDRGSIADAFITNDDPENCKWHSDILQSKNSTQISECKDGIPHKNTFMNDHRNFSFGKMDQAMFIVKERDYPADKDMVQRHRSGLLDQGKQDKCEKLENKLSSICASHIRSKTKDMPKEDSDIETIYKSLPAVATLYKSLESNVLAVPVVRSGKEVHIHALPSACMFLDPSSKLAPPMDSSKRESLCVTIMHNTCPINASSMSTTPENNEPHYNCSVNDDLRSVICVDPIMCGCKAMNSSDKNDKLMMYIREKDASLCDNSNEQNTQLMPSCDSSNEQNTQLMPSCDSSNEQNTQPMPSGDNSNEQNTQPMPSCDNSNEQNTQPMPSCDNSNEQNTQPMPSCDSSNEQNTQPMPSCDNSNEQNTQPMPSCDSSIEQNTQPMPSYDNSNEQNTQLMPSCDSSNEQNTQPMPSCDSSNEQNTPPMPSCDSSNEQNTQPMSSCDSSIEHNTQPMPSFDSSNEQNNQPMPSFDSSNEQNTQPMPSFDNSNKQNTQPVPSFDSSNEQNTPPMPSCDNSNKQNTPPMPSVDNSDEQNIQPMSSVDNLHEQNTQPMSYDISFEQNAQPVPSIDNSHEQIIQPVPLYDNWHKQSTQPMPSVDNSSVNDAHALPTVDKSCDHIEQVPFFLWNSETGQGHENMGTDDQAFHSLKKDNEDSLSKSLQSWCTSTALNIQPVQPCSSDLSSIEMQNSSKSSSDHAAVDYGDIYDFDVSGNLQPYSLEQNSAGPEKTIPLFTAHALSLDDEDRFGLDEIIYHPAADLVWKGDDAHNFHRQSDQSKNNHEDIRGNISASSTKDIKLIIEDKCETLGMTRVCGGSTFNNLERIIRNLSQPTEFAGLFENDTALDIQPVSKEILLDKVNLAHNCKTEINKDNKNSERGMDSDADLIREILSQEDKIHEKGNYSLIEKSLIEKENRHATQTYDNCSLCNEKQSSTKTSKCCAEKGSKISTSHTRQYLRINDVLLLEAKKFVRSDILTGNRSGLNRTNLEKSRKRSFRLLLKQLKTSPRKRERKTLQEIKEPCTSKRKGTRQKGKERQLNKDHGSDLVKETCENAAIATEEKKENRESSIITDFSDKTYPCKVIESQTEQLLPEIRIPENMHGHQNTGLENEDSDQMKYGAPRRNRLAQLTDDACNAQIGESSYDSHSSSTFKDCSKTDKMDANINLRINASRENQIEQIPNLEGRKEASSLMAKLNERIEKPNQVCPFDDDINLQDYVSEARMEKQDTDMVSDRFIGKKRHLGVDESSKSKRSRWCCKADDPEQLRFRLERKRHIGKNFRRKLKRHHNDEDSQMAITRLKTDSSETKFKSNVSDHNEKTRGTPHERAMKNIRTKLVFSKEEFEKSKKERRLKRCVYCGEMIREVLHMIHIKKYHPYHCAQCQKDFQSKKFKWEHYLQTHVPQTYPCGPCGRKFVSKSFFERHLTSAAHRHRISDILFQQVKKKSCSKDAFGLSNEAKMSSEMDVFSDLGSFCDAASIADIVQQQSLLLSLIQDQMMLGSGVDVTNLVMVQNNADSQQPSSFLDSNRTGIRVFSDTNAAMRKAFQHHGTSQSSPDLNISYLNDTVNFDHAFVLRNDSSAYTQIEAAHVGADLSSINCTSNYKSCPGNDSGEHGSTGQDLMHHDTSHPGQGPIKITSDLDNHQSSPMPSAGWLSTAIHVMTDDSISHDTEYNLWPDQSLRNISTKNTYSNLQSVSVAPHQMENDCLNLDKATHQSGRACLDSIEAAHQSGKNNLDSILAAQQSKSILDCKQSCINKSISENTESMTMFSSPSCSTGNEAKSSCPKSVANTNLPEFGPFQCFDTSSNQHMVQHDISLNQNADNNESVNRSCEPTKSAISSEALMELDPYVTSTAPIYENYLSNDYHGTSLVASISETSQSILNPSPNYRVPSEENGVNIESEGRLREQLNQILFDIKLSEQQAQQY